MDVNYKNEEKLKRATNNAKAKFGSEKVSEEEILAEYLRLGGWVVNKKGKKIPNISNEGPNEGGKDLLKQLDARIGEQRAKEAAAKKAKKDKGKK